MENTHRSYEIAFLLHNEEDAQVIVKSLSNAGAIITNEGQIQKIKLSYPIKKESEAYFGYFHFDGLAEKIEQLNSVFKLEDKILRFLIVTPPFVKTATIRRPESKLIEKETVQESAPKVKEPEISNAALEEKLEEILQ